MTDIKEIFAANLSSLRSHKGWTQVELGEKLNYSDKTISKWERGESIPDVVVLKEISTLFDVSLDSLLADHEGKDPGEWASKAQQKKKEKKEKREHKPLRERLAGMTKVERKHANIKHLLISVVSIAGVWVLTLGALIIAWAVTGRVIGMIAAYTLPLMFILCIVFNSVWGEHRLIWNLVYVFLLVFSIILDVYLQILLSSGYNVWMLFLIMIPVLILLFFVYYLTGINTWFWKKFKRDGEEKHNDQSIAEKEQK